MAVLRGVSADTKFDKAELKRSQDSYKQMAPSTRGEAASAA
jgi:hypothetical protein